MRPGACVLLMMTILLKTHLAAASTSQVEWSTVEKSSGGSGITATGRVVPQDGALNIESARVQGRVIGILRREGEQTVVGTPLYSISSAECFSLVEENRVATSKKIPELLDGLVKREKQLGLRLKGDACEAVATHGGVLTKRSLESGASFNSGDVMATILDTKKLTIELDVPERDQSRVQPGQKVKLQFASNPGETFSTEIQNVVPTIDPTTRTSKARLIPTRLPKNISLDALVFGDIQIGHDQPTLKVPSTALVFLNSEQYVVAGGEGNARAVPVVVINENDSQSTVRPKKTGSLKEGDQVAVRGAIFILRKIVHGSLP
jgi:Cu(I)/Ag(I) efflux system membrane fusion protein